MTTPITSTTSGLALGLFPSGAVVPAHPLALDDRGAIDWRSQQALTRYYLDAGVHGLAVGVHTTQFALHEDPGMLLEVWTAAADAARGAGRPITLVAGVRGAAARTEALSAAELGYRAALLSPDPAATDEEVLETARSVGEAIPVIGFYMQDSVGGRYLGPDFWRALFAQPSVVGVKIAAFDRYRTAEVVRVLAESGRDDIALLTGNDDNIVGDLATEYRIDVGGAERRVSFAGGLLGQWAVGTRAAVELSAAAVNARDEGAIPIGLTATGSALTEVNSAVFDTVNGFAGCVAGVNEVLRQQGLVQTATCLDTRERLSPGQSEAIADARRRHPGLLDEDFIAENRDRWLG
ncbi:MAG: dihydrodipicolinate synthase family protein [Microbacterium sp.]